MLNKGFSTFSAFVVTVIAFFDCLVSRPPIPYAFTHENDRVHWPYYNNPEEDDFVTFDHSSYDDTEGGELDYHYVEDN
ncbi:hypothetical protein J6X15_01310 [Candidatus Saccharibacteria bacterium]|nr:hypothetical protein [Candidatus Saccharibacteria bacterium]